MGKKKQKVRWTAVEENFFTLGSNSGDDESSEAGTATGKNEEYSSNVSNGDGGHFNHSNGYTYHYKNRGGEHYFREGGNYYPSYYNNNSHYHQHQNGYAGHRYGRGGYHNSGAPIAPRFERKARAAAAAAAAAAAVSSSSAGEEASAEDCCIFESEHLPDGFTKIRSKNLDVLFKKEYYAHKIEMSRSNGSSEHDADEEELDGEASEKVEKGSAEVDNDAVEEEGDVKDKEGKGEEGKEQGSDNDEDQKKMKENDESPSLSSKSLGNGRSSSSSFSYSPNAPPFIPSSQTSAAVAALNNRPNLFLYSPSSNTMIPCEEIIIPNPVMGPEGPVYQGPSNIYLAFPSGDSGSHAGSGAASPAIANYITHQIVSSSSSSSHNGGSATSAVQYDLYGVPYQSYQQQHLYQSSSESGGGTEPGSADSTSPHSPPDLSMYSPAGWADSSATFEQHQSQEQQHQQLLTHQQLINGGMEEDFDEETEQHQHLYDHHQQQQYSQRNSFYASFHGNSFEASRMEECEEARQVLPYEENATADATVTAVAKEVTKLASSEAHSTSASGPRAHSRESRNKTGNSNRHSKKKFAPATEEPKDPEPLVERHIPGLNLADQPNKAKKVQKKKRKKKAAAVTNELISSTIDKEVVDFTTAFLPVAPEEENLIVDITEKESELKNTAGVHLRDEDNESPLATDVIVSPAASNLSITDAAEADCEAPASPDSSSNEPDNLTAPSPSSLSKPKDVEKNSLSETYKNEQTKNDDIQVTCSGFENSGSLPDFCNNSTSTNSLEEETKFSLAQTNEISKHGDDQMESTEENNNNCQMIQTMEEVAAPAQSTTAAVEGVPENRRQRNNNKRSRTKKQPSTKAAAASVKDISITPSSSSLSLPSEAAAAGNDSSEGAQKLSYSKVLSMAQSGSPPSQQTSSSPGTLANEEAKSSSSLTHDNSNQSSAPSTPNKRRNGSHRKNSKKIPSAEAKGSRDSRGQRKSQTEKRNNNGSRNGDIGTKIESQRKTESEVDGGEWETKRRRSSRKSNRAASPRNRTLSPFPDGDDFQEAQEQEEPFMSSPGQLEEKENISNNPSANDSKTENEPVAIIEKPEDEESELIEVKEELSSRSVSSSTSRPKRKKKNRGGSQEAGESSTMSKSSIRPVLIQDGVIDVASSLRSSFKRVKRASEILDGHKLTEAVQRGHLDSLIISSVGHGISVGPMTMGRFGISKYTPPDRTHEIPIELRTEPSPAPEETNGNIILDSSKGEEEEQPKAMGAASQSGEELDLD